MDADFPEVTGDTRRMNSNHAVATIADALAKGLKVDTAKAYEACRKGIEEKNTCALVGSGSRLAGQLLSGKRIHPRPSSG